MGILGSRVEYKPFQYPIFFEQYKKQQQAHWLPEEVPMKDDVEDWDKKLTAIEKHLVINVLKYFTAGDLDVQANYMDRLISRFHLPEVRMMLATFSAFEALHAHAYAYLSDSLNLDKDAGFYSDFLKIPAMEAKHAYLDSIEVTDTRSLALCLGTFGGFIEGVQLFSSFAILNSFPRRNLLKGMGQIISWSVRDEQLHAESITKLFRIVAEEEGLWDQGLKDDIHAACETTVKLEDDFIDSCFELGAVPGMTAQEVKAYVRHTADKRLIDLGVDPLYGSKPTPFPWLDAMLNGVEHASFFESRSTSYAKAIIRDDLPKIPQIITRAK